MKIKVLGKAHLEGTSKKTGNAYNFNQVHYLGSDPYVEGQAALTLALDPGLAPYQTIELGATYDVEYGPRNRVVGFRKVNG